MVDHSGCSGSFENGQAVLDKVRMMGFSEQFMPVPLMITCKECNNEFEMSTFEAKCPACNGIYVVTPCHAFDAENVSYAGKE